MLEEYTEVRGALHTPKYREVNEENISKAKGDKTNALSVATVTTTSGKVFYADTESRTDLISACQEALENNLPVTFESEWKLAEPIDGSKLSIVTLAEIREARSLALRFKGSLVL